MPWQTERKLVLAFGGVLVLLLANAVLSYRGTRAVLDASARAVHTHEVLAELKDTLVTVTDAETGQRGFLLTGEAVYLKPYEAAIARLEEHLARLKQLTADNPEQQRRMARLEERSAVRLAILKKGLSLRRRQGFEAARQWTSTAGGREAMEEVRAIIEEIASEEARHLSRRAQESRQSGQEAFLGLALETGLSLALLFLAYYLLRRDLLGAERATSALRAAHDELERQVKERTLELERSNRELQDFAFVASHDLQEPLRKIQAFGGRLKDKYAEALEGQGRDYLERMQNAARRMQTLINDLLALSRVTTKAQPFVPVALEEVARQVVGDLEARIEETGGHVEVGPLPAIEADPLQMRQLLQNLISNALKFHLPQQPPLVRVHGAIIEGGEALAEHTAANGSCQIAVQDNGIGIDEQYLDRIFTPLQRLHARGEYEGTGMGLAVCRKIVEQHGGRITATSTLGQGATFLVTLPLSHSEETEKEGGKTA
ncbi:MAG: sensor histidine kinase [Gammaproteobacteria bacterium]